MKSATVHFHPIKVSFRKQKYILLHSQDVGNTAKISIYRSNFVDDSEPSFLPSSYGGVGWDDATLT